MSGEARETVREHHLYHAIAAAGEIRRELAGSPLAVRYRPPSARMWICGFARKALPRNSTGRSSDLRRKPPAYLPRRQLRSSRFGDIASVVMEKEIWNMPSWPTNRTLP